MPAGLLRALGAQLSRPEYWQTAYHLLKVSAPPALEHGRSSAKVAMAHALQAVLDGTVCAEPAWCYGMHSALCPLTRQCITSLPNLPLQLQSPPFLTLLSLMVPRQPALHGDLLQASANCMKASWHDPLVCPAHRAPRLHLHCDTGSSFQPATGGCAACVAQYRTHKRLLPCPPQLLGRALNAMGNTNHDMAKGFLSIAVQVGWIGGGWLAWVCMH